MIHFCSTCVSCMDSVLLASSYIQVGSPLSLKAVCCMGSLLSAPDFVTIDLSTFLQGCSCPEFSVLAMSTVHLDFLLLLRGMSRLGSASLALSFVSLDFLPSLKSVAHSGLSLLILELVAMESIMFLQGFCASRFPAACLKICILWFVSTSQKHLMRGTGDSFARQYMDRLFVVGAGLPSFRILGIDAWSAVARKCVACFRPCQLWLHLIRPLYSEVRLCD